LSDQQDTASLREIRPRRRPVAVAAWYVPRADGL